MVQHTWYEQHTSLNLCLALSVLVLGIPFACVIAEGDAYLLEFVLLYCTATV